MKVFIFLYCVFNFFGCASAPQTLPKKMQRLPGIYHRVEKGQTLWRISRMYNLELEELVRANGTSETAKIGVGQLIFIPAGKKIQTPSKTLPYEDFIWPAKGKVVLNFGQLSDNTINKGIEIQLPRASDIVAAHSGRVVFYNPNFGNFGKTVIIEHPDGFSTVYAKNYEVSIKVGDFVPRGGRIARSKYLHFEIRKGLISQNPQFYLP